MILGAFFIHVLVEQDVCGERRTRRESRRFALRPEHDAVSEQQGDAACAGIAGRQRVEPGAEAAQIGGDEAAADPVVDAATASKPILVWCDVVSPGAADEVSVVLSVHDRPRAEPRHPRPVGQPIARARVRLRARALRFRAGVEQVCR